MRKVFKSPAIDHVMSDPRGYWNMLRLPPMDIVFTIEEMKYEIKTSTIPNAGYGLFA